MPELSDRDILFLESVANAISTTLYDHGIKIKEKGIAGHRYITHDDYDKLRDLAKRAKLAAWDRTHKKES